MMRPQLFIALGVFGCLAIGGSLVLFGNAFQSAYAAEASIEQIAARNAPDSERFFDVHIAPLIARHCLECHDSSVREGRLDLSRKELALEGGRGGPAIVPGDLEASLLWEHIDFGDMPPEEREPLSNEEKELLKAWIEAGAVWSGDEISATALTRDGRALEQWLQRLTVDEYIETVRSAVGVEVERDARRILPRDLRADGFSNTAYNLNVDLGHVEAYAEMAGIIVDRMDVEAFLDEFADCDELEDPCMREVIASMGQWLLRGPLEAHEINAFLRVAHAVEEEGGDFTEAASYIIETMLQSPRFIYRVERQRGDGTMQPVTPYELASRMSYIIWGGPPDRELMAAADSGELDERSGVESQVRRMLEDPRAVDRSSQFIYEWMGLERLGNLSPNPEMFPNWNSQIAADMAEETVAFFQDVAWEQERPLWDLMNAQVTHASPRLAEHYGLETTHADAAPRYRSLPAPERITNGLVALYEFQAESGDTVRDVSNAGEPLDLTISNPEVVQWSEEGLALHGPTLIQADRNPSRLVNALRESNAVTLEAWVTPADNSQDGPARIMTLSNGIGERNFTLGQDGDQFDIRMRSTGSDNQGHPSLSTASGAADAALVHVVFTRTASGQQIVYINGEESQRSEVEGDFSNWNDAFQFALGNETSEDRPWQGTLHLAAVYDRPLSLDQVRRNHAAGARGEGGSSLVALYQFEEGSGDTIHDAASARDPLNLHIADTDAVEWTSRGLKITAATRIATESAATRLINSVRSTGALTVEAWITPENASQDGPARIASLSNGTSQRNFTIGQQGNRFDARFRTTMQGDNNGLPAAESPGDSAETRPTHLVYTRSANGTGILYVNGEEAGTHIRDGNLSNWDESFSFMIANETSGDRPWRGTYHALAIYNRALSQEEIQSKGQSTSRYDLADVPERGGLMTQGSVLTIGGDDASMVARGLFVLHDILYSAVGNAPPCVDTTPVPPEPGMSRREVAETRLADPNCNSCHARFEPLAFGLEKFDGIAAHFAVDEHGNELREDGEILFPGTDKPVEYETIGEMMDLLAESDRVRMNITRKVTQFALGRPLVESDAPFLEQIHAAAEEGGGTYTSLVTAIVLSDLVQKTRTETYQ